MFQMLFIFFGGGVDKQSWKDFWVGLITLIIVIALIIAIISVISKVNKKRKKLNVESTKDESK